jgi:hypothetical protein
MAGSPPLSPAYNKAAELDFAKVSAASPFNASAGVVSTY